MLRQISKCHNFFNFGRSSQTCNSLHPLMTNILTIKLGWNWMKTVGAVAFWRSWHRKFAKCTEWPQSVPYDCLIYQKVWLRSDDNWGSRSSILKFPAPYGPVSTKISKSHKIYNYLFSHEHLTYHKLGSDGMKIVVGVAFWDICFHTVGPNVLNENEKKVEIWKVKILKKAK